MWLRRRPGARSRLLWRAAALLVGLLGPRIVRAAAAEPPPPADQASGVVEPAREAEGERAALWIPRVILFVPRWAIEIGLWPVRRAIRIYDQHGLKQAYYDLFWNRRRTFGAYPIAQFRSGFGASVGAHLVHRDLFGRGEGLNARGTWGGEFGQSYAVDVDSGARLGPRVKLRWLGRYRIVPADRFYGIGNADTVPVPPWAPADPRKVALDTRFRHEHGRWGLAAHLRITPHLTGTVVSVFNRRVLTDSTRLGDAAQTFAVYDRAALTGADGLLNNYSEVSLDWDTRRHAAHVSSAVPSRGAWIAGWAGWAQGLADDPSRYARLGLDAQGFFDLFGSDRVLRLRLAGETVTGGLTRVPFVDLPQLGGPRFMRGYDRARFRDRVAMWGTAEYVFPIDPGISGFLFLDPGRVWPSVRAVDLHDLRLGYGGGLQFHARSHLWMRLQIASSIDGGVFVNFNFDPGHVRQGRW